MKPYPIFVQASPSEVIDASGPGDMVLAELEAWPNISEITVVMPELEGFEAAAARVTQWGYRPYVGDTYNVAKRLLGAAQEGSGDWPFTVRVLGIWMYLDLEYVDRLVASMSENPFDLVASPRDYDLTCAADVAGNEAMARVAAMEGTDQVASRARFNPWGYMEMNQEAFSVRFLEPAPMWDKAKIEAILKKKRNHPENEFFGRDYVGSRYHMIMEQTPPRGKVLDMACGSGFGSKLISETADLVIGVDYLDSYVRAAREKFPEHPRLRFAQGDGAEFLPDEGEGFFDTAVSLHTLEHVPHDVAMLKNIHRNLKPGGKLIVEVPLQAARPLGVPINPWHLREYGKQEFIDMVKQAGFSVDRIFGSSRSFYGDADSARDALQIWATRTS